MANNAAMPGGASREVAVRGTSSPRDFRLCDSGATIIEEWEKRGGVGRRTVAGEPTMEVELLWCLRRTYTRLGRVLNIARTEERKRKTRRNGSRKTSWYVDFVRFNCQLVLYWKGAGCFVSAPYCRHPAELHDPFRRNSSDSFHSIALFLFLDSSLMINHVCCKAPSSLLPRRCLLRRVFP